jgi:carboxymethylenebutenolidase
MHEERPTTELLGGAMRLFVAAPDAWPPGPTVIVIQEWWGLNAQIEGVARRLAEEGFAAIAPDLYRGGQVQEPGDARKLAMQLDRPAAVRDMRALVGWALGQGATRVGAMGFCMGGGIAWELALSEAQLGAVVPFQAHYGSHDHFPPEMYEAIRRHLADAPPSEFHWYEGAGHAFMNEERESFDADAAAIAWERLIAFLNDRLR